MGKHLPFYQRFHLPILERRKRFTLRNECYGQPGDIIPSDVGPLRILSVRPATPAWVRDHLWADEGCSSPDDFEKVWRQIHPNKPDMDRPRWLHEFEPVDLFDPCLPNAKPEWMAARDVPKVQAIENPEAVREGPCVDCWPCLDGRAPPRPLEGHDPCMVCGHYTCKRRRKTK